MVLEAVARTSARQPSARQPGARQRAGVAAFSLIEAAISTLILLMVSLSVLGLWVRSMANTMTGQDYTDATNYARSLAEELLQLPFDSPRLRILEGTERVHQQYLPIAGQAWIDGTLADAQTAGAVAVWTRTATIRKFAIDDLETPLPAGIDANRVHLAGITITVASQRQAGALGGGKRFTLRVRKSQ